MESVILRTFFLNVSSFNVSGEFDKSKFKNYYFNIFKAKFYRIYDLQYTQNIFYNLISNNKVK